MGAWIRNEIVRSAPKDTGNMATALGNSAIRYNRISAGKFEVVLTNRTRLGTPTSSAPRGTIRDFLKDFPQFRTKRRGAAARLKRKPGHRVGDFIAFRPQMIGTTAFAWWILSSKAKKVLKQERRRGRYGGESALGAGRSPYFWLQDKGTDEGEASAAKAGLRIATRGGFVARAFKRFSKEYRAQNMRGIW